MRLVLLVIFTLHSILFYAQDSSSFRAYFHKHMESEAGIALIMEDTVYAQSVVVKGYKALAECMMAEHHLWPGTKLSYFRSGKNDLETLISLNPKVAELRYMRLLIQLNVPSLLDYSENIEDDINFLASDLKAQIRNSYWEEKMCDNLMASENMNEEYKALLITLKSSLYGQHPSDTR